MRTYQVGDEDIRPWGHYVVTSIGVTANDEGYCEKIITVKPGQVLSLQSHEQRRETWIVKKGTLTALRDAQRFEIFPRESIHIPTGSIHCMGNLGKNDCVVKERQEGICREEDIKRYMDAYNRSTVTLVSPEVKENLTAYLSILADIEKFK